MICACDRSWMSKLVAPTDVGKAFAFFGLFQAIAPLLATPVVGVIYTWSSKVDGGGWREGRGREEGGWRAAGELRSRRVGIIIEKGIY